MVEDDVESNADEDGPVVAEDDTTTEVSLKVDEVDEVKLWLVLVSLSVVEVMLVVVATADSEIDVLSV